ncbi:hypothetical protein DQ04_02381000 [Trypanosoma grayi]|uniref:hypothetical protein n=1 Tax=Trypanosoma grayi TaxID=71804 RepID=UPI0004F4281B|nr:hypothetical protein DQ04_02381000 [Trypanosoma grayi]KEG11665.1 hypothetical protein DQ04_02381000 [Trypanosoma grayi]
MGCRVWLQESISLTLGQCVGFKLPRRLRKALVALAACFLFLLRIGFARTEFVRGCCFFFLAALLWHRGLFFRFFWEGRNSKSQALAPSAPSRLFAGRFASGGRGCVF